MDWLGVSEGVLVVVVVAVALPLVWWWARRRWLSRDCAAFDCAWRDPSGDSARWRLGIARYRGATLEWFPALGLRWTPRFTISQGRWRVVSNREPSMSEAVDLFSDQTIVQLREVGGSSRVELALSRGGTTGFLSWIESAPPGQGDYGVNTG